MRRISDIAVRGIVALGPRFLPFADVGSREVEIAGHIDRMTQRLERIITLLSSRPDA